MQIVFEFCLFLSDFPTRQIDLKSIVLVGKSDKKKRIFKTISIVIQNVALATPGGEVAARGCKTNFPCKPRGAGSGKAVAKNLAIFFLKSAT